MYHGRGHGRDWDVDFVDGLPPAAAGAFGLVVLFVFVLVIWGLLKTRHTRPEDPQARERARVRARSRRRQAELRERRLALQRKRARGE